MCLYVCVYVCVCVCVYCGYVCVCDVCMCMCVCVCVCVYIAVCTVKNPDDGQRNCPKHVEFYSENKFEKLVHLVDCIIRIYHDAWSPERQNVRRNILIYKG